MADLICVIKDGEVVDVHPDALKEHHDLGWREHHRSEPAVVAEVKDIGPGKPRKTRS